MASLSVGNKILIIDMSVIGQIWSRDRNIQLTVPQGSHLKLGLSPNQLDLPVHLGQFETHLKRKYWPSKINLS